MTPCRTASSPALCTVQETDCIDMAVASICLTMISSMPVAVAFNTM